MTLLDRILAVADLAIFVIPGREPSYVWVAGTFPTDFVLNSPELYLKMEVRDCCPTDPGCRETSRVADGLPLTGRHTRALKGGH